MYIIDNEDLMEVVLRVNIIKNNDPGNHTTVIIRGIGSANGSQRYIITLSPIGWAHTTVGPCTMAEAPQINAIAWLLASTWQLLLVDIVL